MIELEKTNLKVEHVYVLVTKDYTADYIDGFNDDGDHPYKGECAMGIYKKDYNALKAAGFKCEEYTHVVLASSKYDNGKDFSKHTIRQALRRHVVYVDKVDHTNF